MCIRDSVFSDDSENDSGLNALKKLVVNGRRANGLDQSKFFAVDQAFDALVLNANSPLLQGCSEQNLCSTIVYGSDLSMHLATIVNGKWCIKNGRHANQETIENQFFKTITQLNCR